MKILEIINELDLTVFHLENQESLVQEAYTGDLLSDVMGNAPTGSVWITIQTHLNVAAVASLKEMKAIILARGRKPEQDMLDRCKIEKIAVLGTENDAFTISGKIFRLIK